MGWQHVWDGMRKVKKKIRGNPLIDLLFVMKGNPRILIFLEPLWGIPNTLILPFTTVYMRAFGITNIQIGLAISLSMVVQVFCAFFGGIVTDKFGRKFTTIVGDLIGWVIPCVIWAFAREYWHFLLAMLLNSFEQVNQTAWVCLLVEDAKDKDILNLWNWVSIAALLAVFFSPLSGLLIHFFSLVPVMRTLYFIYGISMLLKCVVTQLKTGETKQGVKRRKETKNEPLSGIIKGYKRVIPQMVQSDGTMRVLAIMTVLNSITMIQNNFYSLYVTGGLGIPDSYLAYFPIIRGIIMLIFFFFIQVYLGRFRLKIPMACGLILYMIAQLLIIVSPPNKVITILLYTLFEAVANAIVFPRKDLMSTVFIDKKERARITALLATSMLALTAPLGAIVGALSKIDGRAPFVVSLVLFVFALFVILTMKQNPGSPAEEG